MASNADQQEQRADAPRTWRCQTSCTAPVSAQKARARHRIELLDPFWSTSVFAFLIRMCVCVCVCVCVFVYVCVYVCNSSGRSSERFSPVIPFMHDLPSQCACQGVDVAPRVVPTHHASTENRTRRSHPRSVLTQHFWHVKLILASLLCASLS
jgi:hypothetical protein